MADNTTEQEHKAPDCRCGHPWWDHRDWGTKRCVHCDCSRYLMPVTDNELATVTTEQSVEQALVELREMFPGSCPRIEFSDYRPIGGSLVVSVIAVGLQLGNAATLNKAMAQVRQWHAEQAKES